MYKIIAADGKEYGPFSMEDLKNLVRDRRANGDTLVQAEGTTDWKPLKNFPEFADVLVVPAASPATIGTTGLPQSPTALSESQAKDMVRGPSIGLLATGILVAIAALAGIVMSVAGVALPRQSFGDPQIDKIVNMMSGGLGLVENIIGLVFAGITIFAGLQLGKLRNYGFVMTMVILNMIPCCNSCCCLIGLPVGIWAIVVMQKPEIKAAFK